MSPALHEPPAYIEVVFDAFAISPSSPKLRKSIEARCQS
jgi:hypothetical protein